MGRDISTSAKIAFAATLAATLGACSTVESIVPDVGGVGSSLASLVQFGPQPTEPAQPGVPPQPGAPPPPNGPKDIDCPLVEVQDGTSALRVGGQANDSVRYQFDITDTARECQIQGSQFAIKVGVAGRLLLGPTGSPGAYSAPLRIVVRDDTTSKPVISKVYRAEASVTGVAQSPFRIVSEPLMLPYVHRQAADDYTVVVGFDTGAQKPDKPERHARKKRRP
jgi:hypothetical protein